MVLSAAIEIALHQAKFHQVDSIDLGVALGDVAILQFHFDRFLGLDRRHLGKFDFLMGEVLDRLLCVGETVLDATVLDDRLALAQADGRFETLEAAERKLEELDALHKDQWVNLMPT